MSSAETTGSLTAVSSGLRTPRHGEWSMMSLVTAQLRIARSTQQWRLPDDDLPTGYRVAEGVSWLGSVGIIAGAVIAFLTWVGRRLWRRRA